MSARLSYLLTSIRSLSLRVYGYHPFSISLPLYHATATSLYASMPFPLGARTCNATSLCLRPPRHPETGGRQRGRRSTDGRCAGAGQRYELESGSFCCLHSMLPCPCTCACIVQQHHIAPPSIPACACSLYPDGNLSVCINAHPSSVHACTYLQRSFNLSLSTQAPRNRRETTGTPKHRWTLHVSRATV
jgi:hypothetical protein